MIILQNNKLGFLASLLRGLRHLNLEKKMKKNIVCLLVQLRCKDINRGKIKMKKGFFMAAALALASPLTHAGIIDFSDSQFDTTFVSPGPYTDTVSFDGVSFDVTAISRGADGFRQNFFGWGQNFGVAGNGLYSLAFVAAQDLVFTQLTGIDRSNIDADTGELPFELLLDGVSVASGYQFTAAGSTWDFSDITVAAGAEFTIREIGTGDPNSRAIIGALNFELSHARVPEPAGLPLMLIGLGGLVAVRRKQDRRDG
jgi:hypothetical protein